MKPKVEGPFVVEANSKMYSVKPRDGRYFSLEELQEIVGGYIEFVYLDHGFIMILNEEGKLNGLPINEIATGIARDFLHLDDYIVGNVLVCYKLYIEEGA